MDAEPLQRLAAAVTPAVMVSACGLLGLGLDNQVARMTTRVRDMSREFRGLTDASPRRPVLQRQIQVLVRRHALLSVALLADYGALLTFVLTSLLYLGQGLTGRLDWLPVATFTCGVLLLGTVAVFGLASLRLSRTALSLECEDVVNPAAASPAPMRRG